MAISNYEFSQLSHISLYGGPPIELSTMGPMYIIVESLRLKDWWSTRSAGVTQLQIYACHKIVMGSSIETESMKLFTSTRCLRANGLSFVLAQR